MISPRNLALMQGGASMLAGSGYRPINQGPATFGGALGQGAMSGLNMYQKAMQAQAPDWGTETVNEGKETVTYRYNKKNPGDRQEIARAPRWQAREAKTAKDVNKRQRYTSGPDKGELVFPDVEAPEGFPGGLNKYPGKTEKERALNAMAVLGRKKNLTKEEQDDLTQARWQLEFAGRAGERIDPATGETLSYRKFEGPSFGPESQVAPSPQPGAPELQSGAAIGSVGREGRQRAAKLKEQSAQLQSLIDRTSSGTVGIMAGIGRGMEWAKDMMPGAAGPMPITEYHDDIKRVSITMGKELLAGKDISKGDYQVIAQIFKGGAWMDTPESTRKALTKVKKILDTGINRSLYPDSIIWEGSAMGVVEKLPNGDIRVIDYETGKRSVIVR